MSAEFYRMPKSFWGMVNQIMGNEDRSYQTVVLVDPQCAAGPQVDLRED